MIAASVVSLAPVVVCVLTSFKTNDEYASTTVLEFPSSFAYLENFKIAVEKANMLRCFANTALVLIVVLTVSVFTGSMLAYVINRFAFPGRSMIENLFLFDVLISESFLRFCFRFLSPRL